MKQQREIKFRAWSKVNKTMSPPVTLNQLITAFVKGGWELDGSLELFQYTGIKDKNGKEIYEGDICRVWACYGLNVHPIPTKTIKVVRWHDSRPAFNIHQGKHLEVIGNIWENKELLDGKTI